jgi:hypothetical protein
MPKVKISEFSATPSNNTDIDGINIAEGCAPSGINDAIRELMSQLKDFQTGAVGDSFNGPVGTSTAAAGAFTTLSASSTVSGTGFSTYLASPPAIGGTAPAAGAFTTLSATGVTTVQAGSAGAPAITTTGDSNTGIFFPAADTIAFSEGGVESMRIDSSGNLGLGVTPSASNACKNIELPFGATLSARSNTAAPQFAMMSNAVGNWFEATYKINGFATQYAQQGFDGTHKWYNAPSGTAGNAISFTQAMTLDAGGRLLVGRTSSSGSAYSLELSNGTSDNRIGMYSDSTLTGGLLCTTNELRMLGLGASTVLTFQTNGSERMRIDSSGNMGIGTTSPEANGRLTLDRAGSNYLMLRSGGTNRMSLYVDSGASVVDAQANPLVFNAGSAERARIDSSGNLLVGTTSGGQRLVVKGVAGNAAANLIAANTAIGAYFSNTSGTANYDAAQFLTNGGVTSVGSIVVSSSATAYVTSSDYRLKNTIAPMTGALAKVALLKPCTYKWNIDGSNGEGFIAHELAEVMPQCVVGEKDAVDDKGKPQYQGIDTSFLVATLTAAIQELKAEFDAYKATHP